MDARNRGDAEDPENPLGLVWLGQASFDFWRQLRRETWGTLAARSGITTLGLWKVRHDKGNVRGPNRATLDGIVAGFGLIHACQIKELAPYVAVPANVTIVDLEASSPGEVLTLARRAMPGRVFVAVGDRLVALDRCGRVVSPDMEVQPAPAVGVADPPIGDRGDGDPGDTAAG